jgi:hypothetical protein
MEGYVAGAEEKIHVCSKGTSVFVSSKIFIGPAELLQLLKDIAVALHFCFSLYYISVYILTN